MKKALVACAVAVAFASSPAAIAIANNTVAIATNLGSNATDVFDTGDSRSLQEFGKFRHIFSPLLMEKPSYRFSKSKDAQSAYKDTILIIFVKQQM